MEIRELLDRQMFMASEQEWDVLAGASSPEPFQGHAYIRSFLDNFVAGRPLKLVTAHTADGGLLAVLPLVPGRGAICGIPTRELASPTNVHSSRFDFIARDAEAVTPAVFRHLAADSSWDVLKLTDIPEGGRAWQLFRVAQAAGFPVGAWESQRSPYIPLPASYGELLQGLRAKFVANLRRRRKRLAEQGAISVERVAGAALEARHLDDCFALERSGWKGRQGSAASQSPAIRGFHMELLATPAFQQRLSLSLLKLDGQPIAFHYGLTWGGVYSLLMTSYDERFKACSPGQLLTAEVLEDCIARGLREFDFLGCDLPWKLEWTRAVRRHHWLFIFRDSLRGRGLRRIKFGWAPAARRWLARWSARPAVEQLAQGGTA